MSDRSASLRLRLSPSPREICRRVGTAASQLAQQGVDLAGLLRAGGWRLDDASGLWSVGASRFDALPASFPSCDLTLTEALGAEWVRAASAGGWEGRLLRFSATPTDGAGSRDLSAAPLLGDEEDLGAGPVAGAELAMLAGALHRAMELTRGSRWYAPLAVRNRQSFDALARVRLPREPAAPASVPPSSPPDSYLRAFGTAAE